MTSRNMNSNVAHPQSLNVLWLTEGYPAYEKKPLGDETKTGRYRSVCDVADATFGR